MRFMKTMLIGTGLLATVLVAGCQSSPPATATDHSGHALNCDKCKVTYVRVPDTAKGRVVGYTTRKEMECPDCKNAAANFFATGKFEHTCKTCGDSMEVCDAH